MENRNKSWNESLNSFIHSSTIIGSSMSSNGTPLSKIDSCIRVTIIELPAAYCLSGSCCYGCGLPVTWLLHKKTCNQQNNSGERQINAIYLWNFLQAVLHSPALVQHFPCSLHRHLQLLWVRGHGHLDAAKVQQPPWLLVSHQPLSLARGLGTHGIAGLLQARSKGWPA
jgi:hypothetical protein